jgi:hypothetical protein
MPVYRTFGRFVSFVSFVSFVPGSAATRWQRHRDSSSPSSGITDEETGVMAEQTLTVADLKSELSRRSRIFTVAVTGLALLWVATVAWMLTTRTSAPAVLSVQRLEIVEPDGSLAFVIANSQRPVAATIDGQTLVGDQEGARKGVPSIIFFDGKGDEVGGMLMGVRETADGFSATRHLSLDGHEQDQTVVLAHYQDPRGATSGMTVSERPTHSMLDTFAKLGLPPGATNDQLTAAIQRIPEAERAATRRQLFGATRAFFGKTRTGEAALVLRDAQGRQRIVIEAPAEGEPSIRVLDAEGKTVLRLPGA